MKRHVITLGLMVTLSSFALGQQTSQDPQGKTSNSIIPTAPVSSFSARRQLAMLADQDRDSGKAADNKHLSKQEKKARERQKKEEEKRRKKEAKERKKELKEQQKQEAKLRKKERKEQDKERDKDIAKVQKQERNREQKEESKARKQRTEQQAGNQQAGAIPPPPPPNPGRDQDRDREIARDQDRKRSPDQDRDREIARDQDRDRSRDQDHDREIARDQDRKRSPDQDHDREVARNKDRDRSRDKDHDRQMARDQDRDRSRHEDRDRDTAPDRHVAIQRPSRASTIPVSSTATREALRAQRNVSRAIYSQMPASDVIVFVNNANQLVLRGLAPTPSFRQRLLQLAGAAAGGYSVVDQLAANAVGSAASAATGAAIGGVSDLIHGSGSNSSSPDTRPAPAYSGQQGPYAPPPPNGASYGVSALEPGANGCVHVYQGNQVLLTGQAGSPADANRMLQFAQQLGGASAVVTNQLATRTNGATSSSMPSESVPANPGANPAAAAGSGDAAVMPGSVVCVNVNNTNEVLLTGTVGSVPELGKVEQSVLPLLGNARLNDQLNIGTPGAGVSGAGGASGIATSTAAPAAGPATSSNAAVASPSQPGVAAASGTTVPVADSAVEQALHSIPRLSNVDAEVTADSVRLSGSVETVNDQQMAREIARQYAAGKSILDNLTITSRDRQAVR